MAIVFKSGPEGLPRAPTEVAGTERRPWASDRRPTALVAGRHHARLTSRGKRREGQRVRKMAVFTAFFVLRSPRPSAVLLTLPRQEKVASAGHYGEARAQASGVQNTAWIFPAR